MNKLNKLKIMLVEEKAFEKIIEHGKETASEEPENVLPKGNLFDENVVESISENNITEETTQHESLNFDIPVKGKRGRKKGSTNKKIEEPQDKQEPIDVDILLNSILVEPIGGFFLRDASQALYTTEQGKLMKRLMPVDSFKPSWTAFIILSLAMGGGNILKALRFEKLYKNVENKSYSLDELTLIINKLKPDELQFFVDSIIKEHQRREAEKNNAVNMSATVINENKGGYSDVYGERKF